MRDIKANAMLRGLIHRIRGRRKMIANQITAFFSSANQRSPKPSLTPPIFPYTWELIHYTGFQVASNMADLVPLLYTSHPIHQFTFQTFDQCLRQTLAHSPGIPSFNYACQSLARSTVNSTVNFVPNSVVDFVVDSAVDSITEFIIESLRFACKALAQCSGTSSCNPSHDPDGPSPQEWLDYVAGSFSWLPIRSRHCSKPSLTPISGLQNRL